MPPVTAVLALVALAGVAARDDSGRTLELAAPPARIVSTAPAATGALFALGAGPRVVGVTTFCADPPEAREREKVGDFSTIDFEKVLALRPDLVVATGLEQRRAVERLRALGLPVFVLFPSGIDGTLRSLRELGRAVGAEERARELVAGLERRLAAMDGRVRAIPAGERPSVLVLLGTSPLYAAGPGSPVHEAVERAGGRSVTADLGKPYGVVSRETLLARDPDVVVIGMAGRPGEGREALRAIPGLAALRAVRAGAVHDDLDPALLFQENHRLVDGVEALHRLLFPAAR